MTTPRPRHRRLDVPRPESSFRDRLNHGHLVIPDAPGTIASVPAERRILAVMGEVRRLGRWAVPRLFRVRAFLGEVKVDLRANPIPDGFTFDVAAFGSRVTLIVPPEVTAQFDAFAIFGNAINQADEPASDSGAPRIRVRGSVVLGEVRVLVRERDV